MVKILLEHKVDPNNYKRLHFPLLSNPLQIAVQKGNYRIFKLLLESGAKTDFTGCYSHVTGEVSLAGFIASQVSFSTDSQVLIDMLKLLIERNENIFEQEKVGSLAIACRASNANSRKEVPREVIKFLLTCKGTNPKEKAYGRELWTFIHDPEAKRLVKAACR